MKIMHKHLRKITIKNRNTTITRNILIITLISSQRLTNFFLKHICDNCEITFRFRN